MLERPIRHEQPMLEIQVRSTARCAINHLFHETTIFRMNSFQQAIQVGLHRPVVSKDAISFLRPDDFPRGHVPAETAGATQLLRLGQIGLASPQLLLRSFALDTLRYGIGDRCERIENGVGKYVTSEHRHHPHRPTLDH